jgi:5-oxopent-3-ene-1,2,5-tricarboxylate decarboxylase/2-hydroxyhepta-2,4-diene-1,7-dioate isomerase
MKAGTFTRNAVESVAIFTDGRWFDFSGASRHIAGDKAATHVTTMSILTQGQFSKAFFDEKLAKLDEKGLLESYELMEPPKLLLPFQPGKIVCVGRNYLAHAQETGHDAPEEPMFFGKSPQACIAGGEAIVAKPEYGRVDHEAELAVVIGKTATGVPEEKAKECIAGYTLLNDVTARDMQKKAIEQRYPWFLSKSIDTFCPLGPVIVPRDEIAWPPVLDIELRVNGEIRQKSSTKNFIFPISRLISTISRYITLLPGDVIATGTPEGISPLKAGDTVEITIPEIGVLRNPVAAS